jgi:hypothetical protein
VAFGVVAIGAAVFAPSGWATRTPLAQAAAGSDHRVVVELVPGADQGAAVAATRAHGSRIGPRFSHIFNGFAATVTDAELVRLQHDPSVREVNPDGTFYPAATENPRAVVGS